MKLNAHLEPIQILKTSKFEELQLNAIRYNESLLRKHILMDLVVPSNKDYLDLKLRLSKLPTFYNASQNDLNKVINQALLYF